MQSYILIKILNCDKKISNCIILLQEKLTIML